MNLVTTFASVMLIACALLSPSRATAEPSQAVILRVAATVDDLAIFDLDVRTRMLQEQVDAGPATWKQTLTKMIDEVLVLKASNRLGIEVSDEEIDRAINEIRTQNKFGPGELEAELRKQGFTLVTYRSAIRRQIAILRFQIRVGGEKAMKSFVDRERARTHIEIRMETP